MFYSVGEILRNVFYCCYTKIFWKEARLVRYPITARNKANISVSKGFTTGVYCRITAGDTEDKKVVFGENFTMGDFCQLEGHGGIEIGKNVLLGSKILLCTTTHGSYRGAEADSPMTPPADRKVVCEKITIGDNVWIGNDVTVLPGCSIGSGAVIGAGAVVTKNVPRDTISCGNPAVVRKKYDYLSKKWVK